MPAKASTGKGKSKAFSPTKQAYRSKDKQKARHASEDVPQSQQPRLLSFSNDSDSVLHSSPSPPRKPSSSSQPVRALSSATLSSNGRSATRTVFSSQQLKQLPRRTTGKAKARSSASADDSFLIIDSDEEDLLVSHTSTSTRPQPRHSQQSSQAQHTFVQPTQLWADRYQPETSETLAVHRGKIDAVRKWLEEALDGSPAVRAYRRLLVLTGPSGSGKSATVGALSSAKDLNFEIVEWENSWGFSWNNTSSDQLTFPTSSTSATQLFADFLASSSRFGVLNLNEDDEAHDSGGNNHRPQLSKLASSRNGTMPASSSAKIQASSSAASASASQQLMPPPPVPRRSSKNSASSSFQAPPPNLKTANRRRVIVLDDLPNLSHLPTRMSFQATLAALLSHTHHAQAKQLVGVGRMSGPYLPPPIILLLSDTTGRESDASLATDALAGRINSYAWRKDEELNIRSVLGDELRRDPRVSEIKYNPVAPTILKKALVRILDLVHASDLLPTPPDRPPSTTGMSTRKPPKSKKAHATNRDKAFEAELVKILCTATDDGSAHVAEPQPDESKAAGKRKAIERPTGGDLRSAITQMQFALECSARLSSTSAFHGNNAGTRCTSVGVKRDRAGKPLPLATEDPKTRASRLLAVASRRESNLPLFHAVGRILYNKRVGDPGDSDDEKDHVLHVRHQRTAAKVKNLSECHQHEKESNEQHEEMSDLSDEGGPASISKRRTQAAENEQVWTHLPAHLSHLDRRPSKISAEALWSQSPVDPSLLQLYLHHNFPSFCVDIEQCSAGLDYISAADSELRILNESWTHNNLSAYYSFLVTTGGISLSLPSPIPPVSGGQGADQSFASKFPVNGRSRHRQIRKSAFFDAYHRTREMNDALEEAQAWLLGSTSDRLTIGQGQSCPGVGMGTEGPGTDLSSLSSVSRCAMATEVAPLLAKLNAMDDSIDWNGNRGLHRFESSKTGLTRSHEFGTRSAPSPTGGIRLRDWTAALATIGTFDHLTASQAAESAFALRTGTIEDNGLLGGAEGEQEDQQDPMVSNVADAFSISAGSNRDGDVDAGHDGNFSLMWREQEREEADTAEQQQAHSEDPIVVDEGIGLMDSEDEVLSDDGDWS